MDDTKKALLSIDIDTAALTQNVNNAKAAIADLSAQLKELKASGKDSGEAFDKLSEQLKKAGEEAKKSNEALKESSKTTSESTKATADLATQQQNVGKSMTDNAGAIAAYKDKLSASNLA